MPYIPKRPASLAHLTDERAARALSLHFGDVTKAAKELGVDRKDLTRLTWHNPAILDAAHERMSLFIFIKRDEIISGLHSRRGSVRRRAIDRWLLIRGCLAILVIRRSPCSRRRGGVAVLIILLRRSTGR